METINSLLCMSIKCKGSTQQCPHLRRPGYEYCGVHIKSKNVFRVDSNVQEPAKKIKKTADISDWKMKYIQHIKSIIFKIGRAHV